MPCARVCPTGCASCTIAFLSSAAVSTITNTAAHHGRGDATGGIATGHLSSIGEENGTKRRTKLTRCSLTTAQLSGNHALRSRRTRSNRVASSIGSVRRSLLRCAYRMKQSEQRTRTCAPQSLHRLPWHQTAPARGTNPSVTPTRGLAPTPNLDHRSHRFASTCQGRRPSTAVLAHSLF